MEQPARSEAGFPPDFVARLGTLEALLDAPLLEGLMARPATVFRIRRIRSDPSTVLAALRASGIEPLPLPGLDDAFAVDGAARELLTHSRAVDEGSVHIQGASSQRCARLLGARPGERVLDLAAAPGGKTLWLADAMQDQGEIVAVEAVRKRFFRLKDNLERGGVSCVRPVHLDGRRLPRAWDGSFDRVLLDAPCSSEARFVHGDPRSFDRWSLRKVREMAQKQWGLLGTALRCARPGGTIVYATCSFAPEENEATVAAWLGRGESAFELLEADLGGGVEVRPGLNSWGRKRWPPELDRTRRLVPDRRHEGFFVARLRKL